MSRHSDSPMEAVSGPSPKVSVLLPNYNYARFLPEAIGSVLQQDYSDFELIISDDGSTDDSVAVISDFAQRDRRIRFVRQPVNLGLAGNCNWCLSQGRGEYIKFLLADDRLAGPDSLARLVALLEQAPDIVLASSSAQILDEHSEVKGVRDYLGRDLVEVGTTTCRRCLLSGHNQIGEPSLFMFRRRCARHGFNLAYRLWVDVEFAIRVLEQGRFAYSAQPLAAFRKHGGQQSRRLLEQELLATEYFRLLAQFAHSTWLGRKAARNRLFEALYQVRKRGDAPQAVTRALSEALASVGGQEGYAAFMLRRKLFRPFSKLGRSIEKRMKIRS